MICYNIKVVNRRHNAGMAQSVEHVIGNDEVISSILITSSKKSCTQVQDFYLLPLTSSLLPKMAGFFGK